MKVKCEFQDDNFRDCVYKRNGYCTKDEIVIGTYEGFIPRCETIEGAGE